MPEVMKKAKGRKSMFQTHFMQGEAGHDSNSDLIFLKRSARLIVCEAGAVGAG